MNVQQNLGGKVLINTSLSYHKSIEKWIQDEQFRKHEVEQFRLSKKSRKRNKLYCFYNEITSKDVVMKVSQISKEYKFWRKVDLFISSLFKDYNFNSYKCSIILQEAGIDTIIPIAYWAHGGSWINRKSYFLYEKVESNLTVAELCNKIITSDMDNKKDLVEAIANRCVKLVKNIHAANIRHDDPHGGNILTNIEPAEINNIDVERIKKAKFILIDNDRCTTASTTTTTLKLFYDLKCLARFNVCQIPQKNLLRLYLGNEFKTYWWYVLNFWISGGFNIKKRINNLLAR